MILKFGLNENKRFILQMVGERMCCIVVPA